MIETITVRYESAEQMESVIQSRYLHIAPCVLITVFAGEDDSIHAIGAALETLLPQAVIIGAHYGNSFNLTADDRGLGFIYITSFEQTKLISFECATLQAAAETAATLGDIDYRLALLFGSGTLSDLTAITKTLNKSIQNVLGVFGEHGLLLSGGRVVESGVSGVIFDNPKLAISRRSDTVFLCIGKPLTVGAVERERLSAIDSMSTANFLTRYFGSLCIPQGFALVRMSDRKVVMHLVDLKVLEGLQTGEVVRIAYAPHLLEEEESETAEAIWQFVAPSDAHIYAGGARAAGIVLSNSNGTVSLKSITLGLCEDERPMRLAVRVDTTALVRTLIHLLNAVSADLAEQARLMATCPLPTNNSSRYDTLTKLPGRSLFFEQIDLVANPAVALLNINRLRDINNLYGFQAGDQLLVELSQVLQHALGEDMRLFRLGGDSLAVLCDGIEMDDFRRRIEAIQTLTSEMIFLEHTLGASNIRLSAGIAFGAQQILSRAESALRRAKRARAPLAIALGDDVERSKSHTRMLETIKQAIIQPWWVMAYYQPIARCSDGEIVKYEALIRMRDSKGTVHSPAAFLDLAKISRYYHELTRIMIRNALSLFRNRTDSVAINLAPEDLQNSETMSYLAAEIASYDEPARITIEVTESEMIEDYKIAVAAIAEIKKWGAKIAIDDFGSGYSNFTYLIEFEADYIKIDGSIVQKIDKNEKAYQTLLAIVDFAKRLGAETIAEFISSEAIAAKAKEAGVDYLQGYLIGVPASM